MPYLELPDQAVHYRIDGNAGPWLLLSHSLGADLHMWDAQIADLSARFRVLRYDLRGHGGSSAPPWRYSMAELGGDTLALLDALQIERTHFCGLSIGGQIGQWLGVNAGARLDKLVLCATAAKIGTAGSWEARITQVCTQGLSGLVEATAQRWFTPRLNATQPDAVKAILESFLATSIEGYCGCCAALADVDFRGTLARISVPVLAVSGDEDPVCPPADLKHIADHVANGRHIGVQGRHICNLESPDAFTSAVVAFLVS